MRILTPCLIMVGILVWPGMVAAISFSNGGWTTDFNYGEVCNLGGYPNGTVTDCDDISNDGTNWHYDNGGDDPVGGNYTELTAAAASPDGDNSYGLRAWYGDGTNVGSDGVRIGFTQQEPELWIRWYIRYELGFTWSGGGPGYDKWLYMYTGDTIGTSDVWVIPQPFSGGYRISSSGGEEARATDVDWQDTFGTISDGLFHMIEIHLKMDTDSTDGIAQMWVDGTKIIDVRNFDYSRGSAQARAGIDFFMVHQNQFSPANGGAAYVDFSDFAIYRVTPPNISPDGDPWIGPLNGFSGAGSLPRPKTFPVNVSFYDPIEDNNFTSRGWYDKTSIVLANLGATSGSTKSIEHRFNLGATQAVR